MVFHFRGRSRTRSVPFRGRGKSFRGRGRGGNKGQGLFITLNSRNEGRDDRQIPARRDGIDINRRDDRSYHDLSYEEKIQTTEDHNEWRGEKSMTTRNRPHDKIDVSADSESLMITVGNERFHRDRELSPKRSTPLSERLGPPVDDSFIASGSRYHQDDIYSGDQRESLWYSHQEKDRIKKNDQHNYGRSDRTGRRKSPDHDWRSSSSYNSDSSDKRFRDQRYQQHEDGDRDEGHRCRERYTREETRHKDRKYDRIEYDNRDGKYKDYLQEFSRRDGDNRNYVRSRQSTDSAYEQDKYQDSYAVGSRKKRDSSEKSHESMARSCRINEVRRYSSPESYRNSQRPQDDIFRGNVSDHDQSSQNAVENSLISPGFNEIPDQISTSQRAPKPLKSILKKKKEPLVEQHDSVNQRQDGIKLGVDVNHRGFDGSQSCFETQVTGFLKSLQSSVLRSADVQNKHLFETNQETRDVKNFYMHEPKFDVTSIGQNEMDVDAEEEFLYGNSISHKTVAATSVKPQQDTLFPIVEDGGVNSQIQPLQRSSEENEKDSGVNQHSSGDLPSWMRPFSTQDSSIDEKKGDGDDMDKTVQNILKSIGFNFDLSKRMQELAKLKKQKEEEAQFPINKNASFLGAGISSADLKAELFSKESRFGVDGSSVQEVKDITKQSTKEFFAKESRGMHIHDEYTSGGQSQKTTCLRGDIEPLENSKSISPTSKQSEYASQQVSPTSVHKGQESSLVPHFHPPPAPFSSYSHVYQSPYNHVLPPNQHIPPPYGYSMPYPPPQPGFTHHDPHALHIAGPHHTLLHSAQLPPKTKRTTGSSNLTIIPLSDDGKTGKKIVGDDKKKQARKREREQSPEYSRIVLAPKTKERHDSPAKKTAIQTEGDSNEKDLELKRKETVIKLEPKEKKYQKQNPKILPAKDQQFLLKESEERKKKLQLLEKELSKLKKHQNEIMRKRQRQRDGHKDPLLDQNSKLQEEITAQIRMLRKAAEKSDIMLCDLDNKKHGASSSAAVQKTVKEGIKRTSKEEVGKGRDTRKRHEFYDPGNHWCGVCNHVSASLLDHLTHLQSRRHKQKTDPYDRPWLSDALSKQEKLDKTDSVEISAMKGVEFMMSTDAFYCTLCQIFTGDVSCAEAHIKSEEHFVKYGVHIKQNEFYEKRYTLEKTAALSQVKEEADQKRRSGLNLDETSTFKKSMEAKEQELNVTNEINMDDTRKSQTRQENEITNAEVPKNDKEASNVHFAIEKELMQNELFGQMDLSGGINTEGRKYGSIKKPREERDEQKDDIKCEESTKGKIAIKLTGKTGIKPQPKVLPPWTPVTKKIETVKVKPKTENISVKKPLSKSESEPPTSLDTFLTIGGPTTKKLPVYKLRSGTVKKPLNKRPNISVNMKKQSDSKESEELADMKMLGIEDDMSTQIAQKKSPPPRTQNLSLPKELSSQSSSSAEELYTVFFHNISASSMGEINLDDIPMPPPPPQPPSPGISKSEETAQPLTNNSCSATDVDSNQVSDGLQTAEPSIMKMEKPQTKLSSEDEVQSVKKMFEDSFGNSTSEVISTPSPTNKEGIEELQEKIHDASEEEISQSALSLEKRESEVTINVHSVKVTLNADMDDVSQNGFGKSTAEDTLCTEKGDSTNNDLNSDAMNKTHLLLAVGQHIESTKFNKTTDDYCVDNDNKSDSHMEKLNLSNDLTDTGDTCSQEVDSIDLILEDDVKSKDNSTEDLIKLSSANKTLDIEEMEVVTDSCSNQAEDATMADGDDCSSVCSGSSVLMGSDFEVVDEYEAE